MIYILVIEIAVASALTPQMWTANFQICKFLSPGTDEEIRNLSTIGEKIAHFMCSRFRVFRAPSCRGVECRGE